MYLHPDADYTPNDTAADHRDWHTETGLRYGCPWDACPTPDPEPVAVPCALDRDHDWHEFGRPADVYCPGRFTHPAPLLPVLADDPDDLPF